VAGRRWVKTVTPRLVADTPEAQRRMDAIQRQADELGRLNPTIRPKLEKAAITAQPRCRAQT
jgi:hypothetical protein